MKRFLIAICMLACLIIFLPYVEAGELDVLLDKLVDKGYLTPVEATIIKDETQTKVSAEVAEGRSYAVPEWAQKIKIKQDFRLRYQYEVLDSDIQERHRARIRYRLGVITNPFKDIETGIGLATGGADPRSTNQTLENIFSHKGINLDYAYAEWRARKDLKMVGGKFLMSNYLWEPTDLLWDTDINPEGLSMNYQRDITHESTGFVNLGWWNLDERDQKQYDLGNPYMYYVQLGSTLEKGNFDAKVAATVYKFSNVKGNELGDNKIAGDAFGSNTNTEISNKLAYDYDSKVLGGEFGYTNPFGLESIERVAIFGEWVRNFTISKNNDGWASGFKFGHKKLDKPKKWDFKYIYAELGKDAWLDIFPDSDRYGGQTDMKSHEGMLQYAFRKDLILALDFYKSQNLDRGKDKEIIGQVDLNLKF